MRTMLLSQIGRGRTRRARLLAPWLAAVAVPAIAATGYLVLPHPQPAALGPGGTSSTASAPVTTTPPHTTPLSTPAGNPARPGLSLLPGDIGVPTPTPILGESAAYAACLQAVRDQPREPPGPLPGLAGKVARHTTEGWTVVVATSSKAWACNVYPDTAVSERKTLPAKPLSAVNVADVAVADNARQNREPGRTDGDLVWAGGPVPRGVTSIRYTFPDKHVEQAVIAAGFWAMHYFSPKSFDSRATKISVRLSGSSGSRTFHLTWGDDTCNQVSHGC